MKLKLTLARSANPSADIVVTADATATVGDVARAIVDSDPLGTGATLPTERLTLAVAPPGGASLVELDPALPIGEAPVGSGFDARVVHAEAYRPRGSAAAPIAVLRVESGPDAGLEVPLPHGSSTIGRDPASTVHLTDPLVSKRHARLEIDESSIELVDLNSANGIVIDGGLVTRVALGHGEPVVLGDSELRVSLLGTGSTVSGEHVLERGGSLRFNRSPRVEVRYNERSYPVPEVPTESDPPSFSWIMILAPVVMGVVMFAATRSPIVLTIVFLSPLMMLGNVLGQKSGGKKRLKKMVEEFEVQLEELEEQLLHEQPREREARLAEAPSVAEVYSQAHELGPMLWTRRPEHWNFLDVRIGLGRMPSRNTIAKNDTGRGLPAYTRMVDRLREKTEFIDDVPVVENLHLAGALGICGTPTNVADTARALAVQYAGLHSPAEVAFAAILSPASTPEFDWMKWLPHTASPHSPLEGVHLADSATTGTSILNSLEELIAMRVEEKDRTMRGAQSPAKAASHRGGKIGGDGDRNAKGVPDAALIVFVDNNAPVDRARLVQVVERAADARIYPIWMAPTVEAIPASCRTFVEVHDSLEDAVVGFVRTAQRIEGVRIEGVSAEYASVLAKRLSPVVDASAVVADSSDLPRTVSLVTLLGEDLASDPSAVVERWMQNNSVHDRSGAPPVARKRAGTLRALIGQGSPDAMHLDLRTQGPHALVGGTTGSGKSEFLQAWVLGMAAEYSPDRVTFLFVDYKGGSAFAECVNLPHCVGLVTDLSPHLVRRALTSLRAELHHREHLLNRKKAKDLLELEKRGDPECPPALVLVIDEFAALAGEVPEFVDGVVDIAQRGRSLGIHLIMATQRPAGVIKDNLRANTNLRVALRMADENDSTDVVGDKVAGGFDPSIPGRGIAKTGPGRLIPFQSGYAGGWTSSEPEPVTVLVSELRFGAEVRWEVETVGDPDIEHADLGPNDQTRLVQTMISGSDIARIPAPRRPWLDELETTIEILSLDQASDSEIAFAMVDRPELQEQQTATFVPDRDGHLAIFGTSGSGKSAALRSLAVAAGLNRTGGPVHVYGLDFGTGGLRMLESLPHVGSVVTGDDHERVTRLLSTIRETIDDRSRRYSDCNASNIVEYRQIANRPDEPRILLVLDGFPAFKDDYDTGLGRSAYYNMLVQFLGEGRPLGVHVIFTADRAMSVPTAVSSNIQRRIVLRLADETGYLMFDVAKDILDAGSAPGRAIIDGYEAQIAVPGGTANVSEQSKALEEISAQIRALGRAPAPAVGQLPREIALAELPATVGSQPVLGVADETLAPVGFEPYGTFLVAGPPASGKTNAVLALTQSLLRANPAAKPFFFGSRRSALRDAMPWVESALNPEAAMELAGELTTLVNDEEVTNPLVIVVDAVAEFQGGAADSAMTELVKAVNRSDHTLLTDGDVSALSAGWGLVAEVKAARKGIVLMPDTYDGDSVFKVPFPRISRNESPPGRGFAVAGASVKKVHLPLAD
ncbi:DNA segregation ATPase FtsK/SpoIIIE, S-DNA-T family [Paramicrobacterium humi]|uniref:DNA segregation ATPase FtsK/SpoIIIE, S-DNA-T family n=1 Tax=Paramicrobacterium humi TaxID=640635 RepID=A0A1H4JU40_9MICO|nr:FtsK/SpoIIIE domain-containing protein [Microbacterium humi]SEB49506.1 DNA segregation ATPase FtsK/SpoIIIE, S-DNA-T family [Microbacterium humi]